MLGPWEMAGGPDFGLAHINQVKVLSPIELSLQVPGANLANAPLRVLDEHQELR